MPGLKQNLKYFFGGGDTPHKHPTMRGGVSMKDFMAWKYFVVGLTLFLTLLALWLSVYLTGTRQPILNDSGQFTMFVSLLVFILMYCSFISRLKDIINRLKLDKQKPSPKAEWHVFLLTVAASVLFLSLLLCLGRISVFFVNSSSSCLLTTLDGSVFFTLWVAMLLSIYIFIHAYIEPYLRKGKHTILN